MSFKFIDCILDSCSFASLPIGSSSRTGQNVRERAAFADGTEHIHHLYLRGKDE